MTMLTYFHLVILPLATVIYGSNFEKAKVNEKRNDYFYNRTSQSLGYSSTDYGQGEVTSYQRKHPQDSTVIKHNYFFLDTRPARPPGCPPCRKFKLTYLVYSVQSKIYIGEKWLHLLLRGLKVTDSKQLHQVVLLGFTRTFPFKNRFRNLYLLNIFI